MARTTEHAKRVDMTTNQILTTSAVAANSTAIAATHVVDVYLRIASTTDSYIYITDGSAGTPTAATATNGFVLPAGAAIECRVQPGSFVSALMVTAAGKVSVTVLEA